MNVEVTGVSVADCEDECWDFLEVRRLEGGKW